MARQWNGTLATQTVAFRGTSTVAVLNTTTSAPNFRAISGAAYSLVVAGGISGSFGVHILGYAGNTTFVLAGVTAISTAGNRILYPVGYSSTGAAGAVGAILLSTVDINRIDQDITPTHVVFQSGVATVGISAHCTVGAMLREDQ
jgi:hypothetical protein